jgi:hypothetical protein
VNVDLSWVNMLIEGLKNHKTLRHVAFSLGESPVFADLVQTAPTLESLRVSLKIEKSRIFKLILNNPYALGRITSKIFINLNLMPFGLFIHSQRTSIKVVQQDEGSKLSLEESLLVKEIKSKINPAFEFTNGGTNKTATAIPGRSGAANGIDLPASDSATSQSYASFAPLATVADSPVIDADAVLANQRASFKQVPEGQNYSSFIPKSANQTAKPKKHTGGDSKAPKAPKTPKTKEEKATKSKPTATLSDLGLDKLDLTIGSMLLETTSNKPDKKKK